MAKSNIVLTGFMGTGKTTVGQLLAKRLGYVFVDTDAVIVARDGRAIADIFQQDGEPAFRKWEAIIARELADKVGLVIATGGRLMLDPLNAAALGRNGEIFCLTAEPDEIIVRLTSDSGRRPLLDVPEPAEEIRRLLAQRAADYGKFTQVGTDGKSPSLVADEILALLAQPPRSVMTQSPYFCDLEGREAREIAPGVCIRTFWGEHMLLSVVDLEANAVVPEHHHPHEQAGTLLRGELELTIGGESRWLKPGDTYIVPGGVDHSARAGNSPTRVLDIFSPVREAYQY